MSLQASQIARLPTRHGEFMVQAFQDELGKEHLAIFLGELQGKKVLARLHSECLTGDALGSLRCDCGPQLDAALARIQKLGEGVVVYLRQEGRGIGLLQKINAYQLQDGGQDTVDANLELGFPADGRTYEVAAQMLHALQVESICLLSNNPAKAAGLREYGVNVVDQVPHIYGRTEENSDYLQTKKTRMGHDL